MAHIYPSGWGWDWDPSPWKHMASRRKVDIWSQPEFSFKNEERFLSRPTIVSAMYPAICDIYWYIYQSIASNKKTKRKKMLGRNVLVGTTQKFRVSQLQAWLDLGNSVIIIRSLFSLFISALFSGRILPSGGSSNYRLTSY